MCNRGVTISNCVLTLCGVALLTLCGVALLTLCNVALLTLCNVALLTLCGVALLTLCNVALQVRLQREALVAKNFLLSQYNTHLNREDACATHGYKYVPYRGDG